ncbi:hypothetical protein JCM4814A_13270 [Streptomyces phaeofaciens JCM 4814]|uniref:Uncharacterized protein n=1 Tax=Streptomyces phaeofaciens TaxID=68254 RepID=A0A918HSM2_9ACTN|nr:hypothetical protein [Streptomyces phaeofaciens]GGT95685.1 hypothetical protein GCM10010226_86690 [Streptomyces phaeofaciens]
METRPQSPQPPGAPRWAAMFYDPASASWRLGAESPDRGPVLYAIGEMAQARRARGDEVTVALWGPQEGAWRHFDAPAPESAPAPEPATAPDLAPAPAPGKLAERMEDRRHQVVMAGLSKAGLYDLAPDDVTAVRALVDRVDETTLRRLAHWLAVAGSDR